MTHFYDSKLVVYHNVNKNTYYYKIISCYKFDHVVGYTNSYGHVIVLVIDKIGFRIYKDSFRKRVLNKLICFLQNISRKM